jgi:hypothetical protein
MKKLKRDIGISKRYQSIKSKEIEVVKTKKNRVRKNIGKVVTIRSLDVCYE